MELIDKIYCINLDRRIDRWEQTKFEIQRVGLPMEKVQRISAVPNPSGAVGCSMSHAIAMSHAVKDQHKLIMVIEDDCHFVEPLSSIEESIRLATARPDFKAILFA